MKNYPVERLIRIAISLSTEKRIDALLNLILTEAMDITRCDGGTVYIRDKETLRFFEMVTLSKGFHRIMEDDRDILPPVPLNRLHVCACAAMDHKKINIPDVYESKEYDFSGAQRYDSLNGYRTRSMLVIPMEDERGRNIGVLQLINAQDGQGRIIPFAREDEDLISALASLAAVSLNNNRLAKATQDILHSFVAVMVDAVDARSPYNANHTRSMVRYAERFLDWLDTEDVGWRFTQDERDPFLMSVWLHDIGKLVIPLEIMDKQTRLGAMEERILGRIEVARLMEQLRALKQPGQAAEAETAQEKLRQAAELIAKANTAGFLPDETIAALRAAGELPCLTAAGESVPLLRPEELEAITVRRGTLTAAERGEIERHVVYTGRLLQRMTFRDDYEPVPAWAAAHHEFLNGSGYPEHRTRESLPKQVRLLTILDIYDALTAEDRPYKPPMPAERAFSILESMRDEGKLDGEILELFHRSGAWKKD